MSTNAALAAKFRGVIDAHAREVLRIPGVIAVEPGYRTRNGEVTDEPAVVVTVEDKVDPQLLVDSENLQTLFGADQVDVVEADPLKALFAQPERYGIDAETLVQLEDQLGNPFGDEAIGLFRASQPPTRVWAVRTTADGSAITYRPPAGLSLTPVRGKITLRCHAGPDAGWAELRAFLMATKKELVVGMFELTAPHIGDFLIEHLRRQSARFKLILNKDQNIGDGTKKDDRPEAEHNQMLRTALRSDFQVATAAVGPTQTFFSDYHIKLAVRDRAAFWLSSGSWQSSNQPALDPLGRDQGDERIHEYNREWHVIGEHADLSDTFGRYLDWDYETARREGPAPDGWFRATYPEVFIPLEATRQRYPRFFAPAEFELDPARGARVLPLLTPDNYIDELTRLVDSAQQQLLVQNQSLGIKKKESDQDPRYTRFLDLLARKSHEVPDFRLILRDFASGNHELYQRHGFNVSRIRYQKGAHNKGIVVDGRATLVGSHNFSNAGTIANRDASLIIEDAGVAAYFRRLLLQDWDMLPPRSRPQKARLALPGELPPPGMRRVSFHDYFDLT